MSQLPSSQAEAALERLAEQFTDWRQSRPRRERIPSAWWAQAVSLSHVLPVSRVAKRLGLGVNDLKKRCGSQSAVASPSSAAAVTFVEVTAPASRMTSGVELEVQRPDGVELRLTAEEATPALTTLIQTFWERR